MYDFVFILGIVLLPVNYKGYAFYGIHSLAAHAELCIPSSHFPVVLGYVYIPRFFFDICTVRIPSRCIRRRVLRKFDGWWHSTTRSGPAPGHYTTPCMFSDVGLSAQRGIIRHEKPVSVNPKSREQSFLERSQSWNINCVSCSWYASRQLSAFSIFAV